MGPLLLEAHHSSNLKEGRWYNVNSHQDIRVKTNSKGIKIKGFYSRKAYFKYNRFGELFDKRNRELRILRYDKFVIIEPSGRRYVFVDSRCKVSPHPHQNHHTDDEWNFPRKRINLEGSWYFLDHQVAYIVRDRNGLKTRIRGKREWIYYSQMSNKNRFVDKRGNVISIKSDGVLIWETVDRRQLIELNKFSDELI